MPRLLAACILLLLASACDCGAKVRFLIGELRVEPTSLDFGAVPVGDSRALPLSLTNTGEYRLALRETVLEQPALSVFSRGAFPRELDPGQTTTVEVLYRPDGVASQDTGKLIFQAEGEAETLEVILTGRPTSGVGGGSGGGGGATGGGGGATGGGGGATGGGGGTTGGGGGATGGGGGTTGGGGGATGGGGGATDAGSDAGALAWPDAGFSTCPDAGATLEFLLDVSDAGFQITPQLIVDAQGFALTWVDDTVPTWVAKIARLSPTGVATTTPGLLLPPGVGTNQLQPMLAPGDGVGDYGAALQFNTGTSRNIYFGKLDTQLALSGLGGHGHAGAALPMTPVPVWNPLDREWGLFWNEVGSAVPSPRYGIWMARLTTDGTYLERHPISAAVTPSFTGSVFGLGASRGVIWNGDGYAMASMENSDAGLILTRISRDGGVESEDLTGSPQDMLVGAALAWDGAGYGVAWLEWGTPQRLLFQRADAAGQFVGAPQSVSTYAAPPLQNDRPRPMSGIVATGDGWFVTWLEFENGGVTSQLWGVKLAANGAEIAGTRRRLTCGAQASMQPSLVWTGTYAAIAFARGTAGGPQRLGLLLHHPGPF